MRDALPTQVEASPKVVPFEPERVRQIREELRELDDEADRNVSRQLVLEHELRTLGYSR